MKEELIKNEKMKKQLSKEILKELNDIKIDLIEISIDNTQKFLKDKINDIAKNSNNLGKKKKKNDSRKENYDELDLGQFPDLNVEKRDKERKVKRTTQRLRKKRMTTKMLNIEQEEEQFNKNKGDLSKLNLFGNKHIDEEKRKIKLPQQLSVINDLSLFDIEDNSNRNKNYYYLDNNVLVKNY